MKKFVYFGRVVILMHCGFIMLKKRTLFPSPAWISLCPFFTEVSIRSGIKNYMTEIQEINWVDQVYRTNIIAHFNLRSKCILRDLALQIEF